MAARRVMETVRRAKQILQTEGFPSLLRHVLSFLNRGCFQYETYYLYEHTLKERNEAEFMPRIQNFTFKIVSNNQQADELAADGLEFRSIINNSRQWLDKGAVAFCIFADAELAHIGWVAMTEEAKNTFDPIPYRVDFSNKEACTGGTWTNPEYRGNGLMVYGYFKRFQFLRERGIRVSRNIVAKGNIASQTAHAKFAPKIHGEARYLKILWWQFWREKPLTQAARPG